MAQQEGILHRHRLIGPAVLTAMLFTGCTQLQLGTYDPGNPTINGQAVEEIPPEETDDLFIEDNTVVLEGCELGLTVNWSGQVDITREGQIYGFSTAESNGYDGLEMLAEGAFLTGGDTWLQETAIFDCPIRWETDFEGEITSARSMDFFEMNTWTVVDEGDEDCWIAGGSCEFEVGWELEYVES